MICWQLKVLKSSVVGPVDSQMEFESLMIWWQSNVFMSSVVGWLRGGFVHSQNEWYQVLWVVLEDGH